MLTNFDRTKDSYLQCRWVGTVSIFTFNIHTQECVEAINEYAFVTSEYPVILSIENHCKSRATLIQKMANIFTSTFGDKLMKEPFDDLPVGPTVPRFWFNPFLAGFKPFLLEWFNSCQNHL